MCGAAVSIAQISIHAPAKGATCMERMQRVKLSFQSTLPRRERRHCQLFDYYHYQFQSTLPRRERRLTADDPQVCNVISIHAPAKGATLLRDRLFRRMPLFQSTLPRRERPAVTMLAEAAEGISIHAPAKGATATPVFSRDWMTRNFNPRSREGSDKNALYPQFMVISIHAPAKGAT